MARWLTAHNPWRECIPFWSNSNVKLRTAFLCILSVDASSASGAANNSSQVCFISPLYTLSLSYFFYFYEPLVGKPLIITQVLDFCQKVVWPSRIWCKLCVATPGLSLSLLEIPGKLITVFGKVVWSQVQFGIESHKSVQSSEFLLPRLTLKFT